MKVGDVLEVSVAVSDKVGFSDEEGASEEQLIPAPRRLLHSPTEHLDGLRYRTPSNTRNFDTAEGFRLPLSAQPAGFCRSGWSWVADIHGVATRGFTIFRGLCCRIGMVLAVEPGIMAIV